MRIAWIAAFAAFSLVATAFASPSRIHTTPVVAESSVLISGTVQLADGTPVAGALVSVRGLPITAVSDANGAYTVSVPAIGFVVVDAIAAVGGGAMHDGSTAVLLPAAGGVATAAHITIYPSFPFPIPPIL